MSGPPPDDQTRDAAPTLHAAPTGQATPTGQAAPLQGGPGPAPAFVSGNLLAGRYRIVGFLGQGGMGQVFEAFDIELQTPVALKTLRPQAAQDDAALERFRREILLARRVSHLNVCRIFDVGQHRTEEGGTTTFLTMELLPGESLDRRLRRGRLPLAEARVLAQQLAAALDAAHAAGVVHRDFKSGNVMLVPAAEGGIRAVVTDFGQARARDREGRFAAALTVDGTALGTPAYMSPEQLTGGEVGPAADIYAFGVVLYEMVTGRWPFQGDSPLSVATRRLSHAPIAPRELVPDLPSRWEGVILRCLERDPRNRFARVADATAALGGQRVPAGRRSRLRWLAAGLASLLLALGTWLASRPGPTAPPTASPTMQGRRSVAVLGFRDLSGRPDSAWLATALVEMLTSELAAGGRLRTVPAERVAPALAELGAAGGAPSPEALRRLGERLGADLVAVGTYLPAGDRVRVDIRVLETRSGETVATLGEADELLTLVPAAGRSLRAALGADAPLEAPPPRPATPAAARLYAEGLDLLRRFDLVGAAARLEQAVTADPSYALAHAALSEALGLLGRDARARAAAERALALSAGLDREERLGIEARAREAARDWPRAIETWGVLAGYFPDNLEHGLRLASAQVLGGQARRALSTLERLRQLAAPASQDPRLDLAEAEAAEELGDFPRELEAARRAEATGSEQGQRLLVARARRARGFALLSLGRREDARACLEQARAAFRELGDHLGEASVVRTQGIALSRSGDRTGARARYEEVLRLCREIGARGCEGGARNNLAILLKDGGSLEAAGREYEAAAAIAREVGDRPGEARVLNNVGIVLRLQGDQRGARQRLEQALSITRELGLRDGEARVRNNLGALALDRADLEEAHAQAGAALALYRAVGEQGGVARALDNLAAVELERDRLQAARALLEESQAIRRSLGSKEAADSRAALAALALTEGRAGDARREASAAAADHARAGQALGQAVAREVEARACLAAGDLAGARLAIAAGHKALEPGPAGGEPVRTALAIAAARLLPPEQAIARLGEIASLARSRDLVLLALEAGLARADAESGAGESRARLEQEARDRGLVRLARVAGAPSR
jgi:TolB-like protein/Tfp pilus assembly protein PilF/tRNA A-37 threonylcarbamoyl transferase component Bud32